MQRLLADSMNGTPVEFSMTKELKGFGVAHVSCKVDNGAFQTEAKLEIYNKAVDGWLKPYMAKDGRAKGERPTVTLGVTGQLNKEGGVDDIQIQIKADHVPAVSAEKLMQLEKVRKDIKEALTGPGRTREKHAKVQDLVERAIKEASEIPVGFFVEMIRDSMELSIDIKEKSRTLTAHAETGKGSFAITFDDILGTEDAKEADIGGKIAGTVAEDRDTLKLSEISVYNTDKLSIGFEENRPVLSRVDAQTGEKTKVDDHIAEIAMYVPMVLALARKDIF
jgi:hypothetical protein